MRYIDRDMEQDVLIAADAIFTLLSSLLLGLGLAGAGIIAFSLMALIRGYYLDSKANKR